MSRQIEVNTLDLMNKRPYVAGVFYDNSCQKVFYLTKDKDTDVLSYIHLAEFQIKNNVLNIKEIALIEMKNLEYISFAKDDQHFMFRGSFGIQTANLNYNRTKNIIEQNGLIEC